MNPQRWKLGGIDLPDAAKRIDENSALRVELRVESEWRPVAAAAFLRDRTWLGTPQRTRRLELIDDASGESLLHF